jgi:hypothetical protein
MKGGDGYSAIVNHPIGGTLSYSRYSNNYRPVFVGELLQNGAGDTCNCNKKKSEKNIFNLITNQRGGSEEKFKQIRAIQEISKSFKKLNDEALMSLILPVSLYYFSVKKPNSQKKLTGGHLKNFKKTLSKLGKNNLAILSSILVLHHYAAMNYEKKSAHTPSNLSHNKMTGGESKGIDRLLNYQKGGHEVSEILEKVFSLFEKNKKNISSDTQTGGFDLTKLIMPLGPEAFFATGLLVLLERVFYYKMNHFKTKDKEKKKQYGGNLKKKMEELFYVLSPISFNVFGTEKTVKDIFQYQNNATKKKMNVK